MKTKLLYYFSIVAFWSSFRTLAQPVCGGTFTDPAGASANYVNNSDYTVTIYPTNPGEKVTVTFTAFNIEANWDALYIFNGNSISAPQIASTNPASNVPGGLPGGYWGTVIPGPFTSSSADGSLTFRFRSDDSQTRAGWIANVSCALPPTCPQPTLVTVTAITATTATIGWTENGTATSWEVIAIPCGTPAPIATSAGTTTSVNPFVLNSLTPSTCFSVYVRAVCSETDQSNWAILPAFTTLIAPSICGGQFVDNGGLTANYTNNADETTTICPSDMGEQVTVTFVYFDVEPNWDALYVYDGNSIAAPLLPSGNPAGNVPGGLAGGFWGTAIPGPFTSSSQDGCLTFRFRSDNTQTRAGWITDITCGLPPTCPRPTYLTASDITPTSVNLGWTENSAATSWEFFITPVGNPAPLATTAGVATSSNPTLAVALMPNTCYTVYVRSVCSETDLSSWSAGLTFCTQLAPPVCGGQFLDNGGSSANYANDSDNIYTICPTNSNETLTVVFNAFDVEDNWDALYVFDGNSIASPQIASSNPAGNVPGGLAGGYWGTTIPGPFTSSSPDGCLTFRFRSDDTQSEPGWNADVICATDADKVVLVAFMDSNNNGTKDTEELLFTNGDFVYQVNDSGTNINGYSPNGQYIIYDTNHENSYDFSYQLQPEYANYISAGITSYSNVTITAGSGTQFLYFPLTVTQGYNDLSISIAPLSAPRPTLNYQNKIVYKNTGLTVADGTLSFTKPAPVSIANINQNGITTNPNGFTYAFTNLQPNESRTIIVTMTVPAAPTVTANQLITATASITAASNDINSANNSSTNAQIVLNSWDPNDKMESRGDKIRINEFTADDYLFYTIRFQNNGNASAININIEDLLDSQIDEESVRMVSASHNYTMRRTGNLLQWEFRNIYLPSANINPNGGIGYVQFKVKANPGFQVGDIIPNNASIYFDANPAVVTNIFNTKFLNALGVAHFDESNLVLYPNPAHSSVEIGLVNTSENIDTIAIHNLLGKTIKTLSGVRNNSATLYVSDLAKGIYLVEIKTENHLKTIKKLVIQ